MIYFTVAELTHTSSRLPNQPDEKSFKNLHRLVDKILDPWRETIGPIRINCAYRSRAVNAAVGGVENSKHRYGLAADCTPIGISLRAAYDALEKLKLPYQTRILYPDRNFIHVDIAFLTELLKPRKSLVSVEKGKYIKLASWDALHKGSAHA